MRKEQADKTRKVVGLTGGVGAGKSRIARLLQTVYGADLLIADEIAHEIMEPGQPGYLAMAAALGGDFLRKDKTIDRDRLSRLIFHDPKALWTVNNTIHPLVWRTVKDKISASQSALIVVESAIVDESLKEIADELWYVYASRENRIRRLSENRGYPVERSESIINNQADEDQFRAISDRVIDNNGSIESVEAQLAAILSGWQV